MTSETSRLKRIADEVLWGKRGLLKVNTLWLPLAVLASGPVRLASGSGWTWSLAVFAAVSCWSQFCILINDMVDHRSDAMAGKSRWIMGLGPAARWAVLVGVAAAGLGIVVLAGGGRAAVVAYILSVAAGQVYSAPPARLKDRGVLGLWGYSVTTGLGFVVLPWCWGGGDTLSMALLAVAVFFDKWVNLLFHEILDYEGDRAAGDRTYVVRAGLDRARRVLAGSSAVAVTLMAAVVVRTGWTLPGGWIAAAAGAGVSIAAAGYAGRRRTAARGTALEQELPVGYLGVTFGVFRAMPLVVLLRLVLLDPRLLPVLLLAAVFCGVEAARTIRYRHE